MYRLRQMQAGDRCELSRFLLLAIHVPTGASPPDKSILNDPLLACYFEQWGRQKDFGIVAATNDGALAGMAWVRQFEESCPGYGFIDDATVSLAISVVPHLRGQGIGTALLTSLLKQVDSDRVGLSVQNSNPAKHLYERTGFVTIRETADESVMLWTNK